jgi:hypothetical protein
MICILGISHRDLVIAERWLRWVATMNASEKPHQQRPLIVFATQRAAAASAVVKEAALAAGANWQVCPDEEEVGYPKSASHLFLRALEHCEVAHPGSSVLWLEADAIPMRAGWRGAIADEYAKCGKPFLGHIERAHGPAHLAGVAVYPGNWRELAPLLAAVLTAPDVWWGRGMGQAFDTWASSQTVPQSAQSQLIQQIWRPDLPITRNWMRAKIRPETVLMHQCKDGSLIDLITPK